jgi:hypothetical protein
MTAKDGEVEWQQDLLVEGTPKLRTESETSTLKTDVQIEQLPIFA